MTKAISIFVLIGLAGALPYSPQARGQTAVAQNWIDGWNSTDPEKLVAAFTPDGVYEDVAFGITKKGSAELRELHKFFHSAVSGLYVKLVDTHVADGYGTIEWVFGGTDVDVFKTGSHFPSEASA